MLSERQEKVKTAADGVAELRGIVHRSAQTSKQVAAKMRRIVAQHGRAALVAELEDGEGAEMLAFFNAVKNIAETYLPDTTVEDLPA